MTRCISLVITIMTVVFTASGKGVPDAKWDEANTAYINAEYDKAIALYDSIAAEGYVGAKLYYNLGNAYYKEGRLGKAILNYNRALRYDPSDSDTRHNLNVANARIKDKIEAVPEFFFKSWVRKWKRSLNSNIWAVVSLATLALTLSCILLYLLSRRMVLRKTGFYGAIAALLLTVIAFSFSANQKRRMLKSTEAVVMSSAASVKSSPDNSSKDIFIVHEGTKVRIHSSLNQWIEITIADGKKGWMHESSIEVI